MSGDGIGCHVDSVHASLEDLLGALIDPKARPAPVDPRCGFALPYTIPSDGGSCVFARLKALVEEEVGDGVRVGGREMGSAERSGGVK